jgi:SAM-dependent methyltransferase
MISAVIGGDSIRLVTDPGPDTSRHHTARNRRAWNAYAAEYAEPGQRSWEAAEPNWGVFSVPESDLGILPPDIAGKDVVELGCGTAYVSAWLARRGARPVGIDLTENQLASALRLQREFDVHFPLVQADAERVPLRSGSFDLAISEYGASIWCDPHRWVPEAARLLRPGGDLVFLLNATIFMLCEPDLPEGPVGDRLVRDYFGMHRVEWPDVDEVEFHLGYGDWIRLLRANGFEVIDLIEVRPPEGATTSFSLVTADWARRWPCEQVWRARKPG